MFDLLVYLVQNRDRVVSKDDLIASVWGGRIVSEFDADEPHQRGAKGGRRQRQRPAADPDHSAPGLRFVGDVRAQPDGHHPAPPRLRCRKRSTQPPRAALPLPDRPAIAVLPFTNMSDDPEQEYFSDGISEDIITALSKLRWFFVIARNSSFIYKGKAVHMKQVADELGVGYVVEGSVRKGGDRVRITAQLNDVATGSHIWAEHYDRDLTDVFAVQDEITEAIVAAIEPQIYAAENFRARRKPPNSLDAWDLVMRALSHYWRVTRQDNVAAQALLEKAIAIDPNYGQALGVLATSHSFCAHMGWADIATAVPIAERAALAAIAADSEDAWAHNAMAVFIWRGGASTIRWPSSNWRCGSIRTSRWHRAITGWRCPIAGAGRRPMRPRGGRCGSVRAIPSRRFITASPPTPSSSAAIMRRRCGFRARRSGSVAILSARYRVLTAAAGMAGQTEVATLALQELRRAQPNISLAWIANQMPWRYTADCDHYLQGLRGAGLD